MPGERFGPPTRSSADTFRVVIVGGGVAGLEAALALADLAGEQTDVTVLAPNADFVYRPMVVREPFADARAPRYPLAPLVSDAGATLVQGELAWIDRDAQTIHTETDEAIAYDALILAHGARTVKHFEHALVIDDRALDETMHGLIQDVEGGYIHKLAFVSPGRMAWPLPLYELAFMTAGRAYDMGIELETTIITPEDSPLAIFGASASDTVADLLSRAGIETINSAYVEVPSAREVIINPGGRHLDVDRIVSLPELYGPEIRGIPLGESGFVQVDAYCKVLNVENVYAAGDITDFPIKQGGIGAQQADTAATAIAALAGAPVTPARFNPLIQGKLLTGGKPQYLTAHITGGHGFSSEITDTPAGAPDKIAAKYLAPYLREHEPLPA
jgi:sulfide:quinone oxidoreductase